MALEPTEEVMEETTETTEAIKTTETPAELEVPETEESRSFQKTQAGLYRAQRRLAFLQERREERRDMIARLRKLVTERSPEAQERSSSVSSSDTTVSYKGKRKGGRKGRRSKKQNMIDSRQRRMSFATQLSFPSWMVDFPDDFPECWMVSARPIGDRTLVIAHNGLTISRRKHGNCLHRFQSKLPGGNGRSDLRALTALDCVYSAEQSCYVVMDVLVWANTSLCDCDCEMRQWFLRARLSEIRGIDVHTPKQNDWPLIGAQQWNYLTPDTLEEAYAVGVNGKADCLLFSHRRARYDCGLSTPLSLLWKDSVIAKYFIDDCSKGESEDQRVNLELADDSALITLESDIALGRVPEAAVKHLKLRKGDILQFSVGGVSVDECSVSSLRFIRKCPPTRLLPDSWSKICFQSLAKLSKTLSFPDLCAVVKEKDSTAMVTDDDLLSSMATLGISA